MNNMKNKEMAYDKDMNEELRQLAKETKIMEENDINNYILNETLRNQIMNSKIDEMNKGEANTGKNNGNKIIGKIFNSKKSE